MEARDYHLDKRRRHFEAKIEAAKFKLEKDILATPPPRKRYSTALLKLRHAETVLANTKRFEEAHNVRRMTKVMEAEEWGVIKKDFALRQEEKRERLKRAQKFERQRYQETTKDMHMKADRYFNETRADFNRTISFQRAETEHALKMEIHKVKSNLFDADPPKYRKINPKTNPSCRGSRKLESIVGKPWLAIPSMSNMHDFKDPDCPIISQVNSRNRFKESPGPGAQTARF